jgi:glycosyltransferase involved in cell wall biosynthesis
MPATLTTRVPEYQPSELDHVADCKLSKERSITTQKVVVVHSGARDAYQLALALSERGLLSALVTDLFWPMDRAWARTILDRLPARLRSLLTQRSEGRLPSSEIRLCSISGLATLLLDKVPRIPLSFRRKMTRYTDAQLGKTAGRLAAKNNAGLVSYSYYGYDAFNYYRRPGILFQLHPHPASMRRILREELAAHPDCASSLTQEWELSLPEQDFQHLVRETKMASKFLVASSFTRRTLIEHGATAEAIRVVPYGVDSVRFSPDPGRRSSDRSKLQLLFVGRINQRKGIKYLLEALRLLNSTEVELTVCGRVVDGLELFRPFGSQVRIRPSVSAIDLVAAYQSADLFVFPSVAEGFGQVLLESLACGLPILSTTHTAAPDLIDEGVQGFIVEPRRPDLIAERIEWAITHRAELTEMGRAARIRAEQFTWERFRIEAAGSIAGFLSDTNVATESRQSHV